MRFCDGSECQLGGNVLLCACGIMESCLNKLVFKKIFVLHFDLNESFLKLSRFYFFF